jgi:DNA-binding response OmpR family regulator
MDTLKILVVDDEPRMRKLVRDFLVRKNYEVVEAADGVAAIDTFFSVPNIALIILDVMMPRMDGWEVCREIRKESKVPIIMLTAKADERDEQLGFGLGVDDYISKPFSVQEVLARVGALLRRAEITKEKANALPEETIQLDTLRKVALVNGQEIRLSPKELGILQLLKQNQGRVFSREEILNEVWKGESCVGGRTVDVHIAHLRRKLGEEGAHINNRQGYGYCFE